MSPTGAEQAERTRRAVLETARRLLVEHGFDATSLQLIADKAGVTKANVYYCHTKIEILEALVVNTIAVFTAMLDTAETIFRTSPMWHWGRSTLRMPHWRREAAGSCGRSALGLA